MTVTKLDTLKDRCSPSILSSRMPGRLPRIGTKMTWKQLWKRTRYVSQINQQTPYQSPSRRRQNCQEYKHDITPLFTYHNSVGSPSSQLILCAYDRTSDTKCSLSSSPAPTAIFAMISFSSVFPSTSMWSPEFGPPRRLHASGECLICSIFHERRRNRTPYATRLICDNFHARWIPAFASPTLCAHGTKRDQGHRSISFAYSNTVLNLRRISVVLSRCFWQLAPLVWTYHSLTRYQSILTASWGGRASDCILPRQIHIALEIRSARSRRKRRVLGCTSWIVQHGIKSGRHSSPIASLSFQPMPIGAKNLQ